MYLCEVVSWLRVNNKSFFGSCNTNYVPRAGIAGNVMDKPGTAICKAINENYGDHEEKCDRKSL